MLGGRAGSATSSRYTPGVDTEDRQRLEALYRALPDGDPLEPGDPRYFPIYDDPELTTADPAEQLARTIEWSDRGTIQFLVGSHRCGKSTELRRLKRHLETAGDLVAWVDARHLRVSFDSPFPTWMAYLLARGAWTDFEGHLSEDLRDRSLEDLEKALAGLAKDVSVFRDRAPAGSFEGLFRTLDRDLGFEETSLIRPYLSLIPELGRNAFKDVLLGSLNRLVKELEPLRAKGRRLVVIVDSLEHVFHGGFLFVHLDWPKFALEGMHQVLSLGPVTADDHNAPRYVGNNVRWIEPLDVYGQGFSHSWNRLCQYLDERSESWRDLWGGDELRELLRFSGGCLGNLFWLLRKGCQDTRTVPIDPTELGRLKTSFRSELPDSLEEDDYQLLSAFTGPEKIQSLSGVAAEAGKEADEDLDAFGELGKRLSRFFEAGLLLYHRDRGYFLHPALEPAVREWSRALPGVSPQLPLPVAIDECLHFKELRIRNLRIFDDFQLTLQPPESLEEGHWILLLGDNGVGKTTFLRSIVLALADRDAANALFQLIGPGAPFLRHGAPEGFVEIRVDGRSYRADLGSDRRGVERIADSRDNDPLPVFAYGCQRGTALGGPPRDVELRPLDDVRTLFEPNAYLIHAETWLAELQLAALQDQGGTDQAFFEAVRDTLVASLDGVDKLEVEKGGEVWLEGPSIGRSPLAALSDAYITTAGWILDWIARWASRSRRLGVQLDGDFRKKMIGLVLIDEIDLHLHPRWQIEIVQTIRHLFPRTSFVATTHNPLTLLGAHPGEIHVLRRDEAGRVEAIQRDIPPGARADQVLTGDWFGLPSTVDHETLELLDRHRELLRQQVDRQHPERREIEDKLRLRLGTFADTSIERMAQSVAAELARELEPLDELGPKARDDLRRRILEEARKRRRAG